MTVPGSNLLASALTVIAAQTVIYYRALSRVQNDVGQYVVTYATGVNIRGSFQPVPKTLYQVYGLDLSKIYYTFYSLNDLIDIQRNVPADQIIFNNKRFQCESNNDWFAIDKWKGVLCILVGDYVASENIFGFNEVPTVNNNLNFEHSNFAQDTEL